jgi:microcystin degradation protein MlrC
MSELPIHPSDPLASTPDKARELMQNMGQVAHGFSAQDVLNAATNIVINALRQGHSTSRSAEQAWDEMMAKAKGQLMDCYDSSGRKKGIYPYHQTIVMPFVDLKKNDK